MPSSKKAGLSLEEGPASLLNDVRAKGICSTQLNPAEADLFFSKEYDIRAKIWCRICPVKPYCLILSIENQEEFGVWGGLNEDERRALKDSN